MQCLFVNTLIFFNLVLVSITVNTDSCNLYKQKLFGVLNHFYHINGSSDQNI